MRIEKIFYTNNGSFLTESDIKNAGEFSGKVLQIILRCMRDDVEKVNIIKGMCYEFNCKYGKVTTFGDPNIATVVLKVFEVIIGCKKGLEVIRSILKAHILTKEFLLDTKRDTSLYEYNILNVFYVKFDYITRC